MTTINVTMKNYEGRFGQPYRGLNADITLDNGLVKTVNTIKATNPVDFIETALNEVTAITVRNGFTPTDVTINLPEEVTLPAGLQTHLVDKYSADPLVSSLIFE